MCLCISSPASPCLPFTPRSHIEPDFTGHRETPRTYVLTYFCPLQRASDPPFLLRLAPRFDSGCFEAKWVVATPRPPALRGEGLPMPPRMWQRTLQQKMRKDGTTAAFTWVYLQICPQWPPVSPNPHGKTSGCCCGDAPGTTM